MPSMAPDFNDCEKIVLHHGFCLHGIIFQGFAYTTTGILVQEEEDSLGTWLRKRLLSQAQHFGERGKKERFLSIFYQGGFCNRVKVGEKFEKLQVEHDFSKTIFSLDQIVYMKIEKSWEHILLLFSCHIAELYY